MKKPEKKSTHRGHLVTLICFIWVVCGITSIFLRESFPIAVATGITIVLCIFCWDEN